MVYSDIFLRKPDYFILAHESAHARHYALHRNSDIFSTLWTHYVKIDRRAGEPWSSKKLKERNGLVSSYAAFGSSDDDEHEDDDDDEVISILLEQLRQRESPLYTHGDIKLYHSDNDTNAAKKTLDTLIEHLTKLPDGLAEHVSLIAIVPELSAFGTQQGHGRIKNEELWIRITEDVAEHTQYFLEAYEHPEKSEDVIRLLSTQEKTKIRLRLLTEYEFLTKEIQDYLSDKDWLNYNLERCKPKKRKS